MLLIIYCDWILAHFQILSSREARLILVLIGLLTLNNWKAKASENLQILIRKHSREILISECIFFFVIALFLVLRSLSPEIYWGEKPMDFTLLNFMNRNTEFPVNDPWFSGGLMSYYYWGYYFFAGLIKVSGVKEELAYALAVATCAGFFVQAVAGLLYQFSRRISLTVLGSLLLTLGSHWNSIWRFANGGKLDIYFFWYSSRLFHRGEFAEFPFWSFLFADLHPHMMSYCWNILFISLLIKFWVTKEKWSIVNYIFLSLSWGVLIATNSWDFIVLSLFALVFSLFYLISNDSKKLAFMKFLSLGAVSLFSLLLFSPMVWALSRGEGMSISIYRGSYNLFSQYFGHQGHWWILILICAFPIFRKLKFKKLFAMHGYTQLVLGLILSTVFLNVISETLVFHDRANSVFKFGNTTYVLWGIIAMMSLRPSWFIFPWKFRLQTHMLAILILAPLILASYLNAHAFISYNPFGMERPSLYGSRYLEKMNPDEYKIVQWIRDNIKGAPVILEAYGHSFDHRAARVSMHTGLPTYLGWTGHVKLRGAKGLSVEQRKKEVDFIYNSTDAMKAHELLTKNKINFLIVGPYEKSQYDHLGLSKFNQYNELFVPLLSFAGSKLYGVGDFHSFTRILKE